MSVLTVDTDLSGVRVRMRADLDYDDMEEIGAAIIRALRDRGADIDAALQRSKDLHERPDELRHR